jgi:hypothetical protein
MVYTHKIQNPTLGGGVCAQSFIQAYAVCFQSKVPYSSCDGTLKHSWDKYIYTYLWLSVDTRKNVSDDFVATLDMIKLKIIYLDNKRFYTDHLITLDNLYYLNIL